jgi:predicted nuclease of predicted toxin-antitoxin system
MKLLVDMNLSPSWVRFLVEAGFEAVHWSEVGSGSAADSELMQWAADAGYGVLTADLDFGAILAAMQLGGQA